jgi:hypothetical protein
VTLNKPPSNPKSKSNRRDEIGVQPELARLPDVTTPPPAQDHTGRAAAAGFVDYRFDMPAGTEEAESRPRLRLQPPAFRRSAPGERRSRPFGVPSRALPESHPFAFPTTSTIERLAPAVRFLTLFLLFTAIGTFVLSTTRNGADQPEQENAPSAAAPAGIEQKLEPTTIEEHPTIATPKAFGPLGANVHEPAEEPATTEEFELPPPTAESTASTERLPSLESADGEPLPKVQTTEMTSAPSEAPEITVPARLTGSIHANEQPRAEKPAKPPAVARLPAIFDAPRHAYQ